MDRVVQKKKLPLNWIIGVGLVAVIAAVFGYQMLIVDNTPVQTAKKSDIRISTVIKGDFQEYFQANAFVASARSIYIDSQEFGTVRNVYTEQGKNVAQGQVLVKLQNDELESQLSSVDVSLKNTANELENNRLRLEQAKLRGREQLLDIDRRIYALSLDLDAKYLNLEGQMILERERKKGDKEMAYLKAKREILVQSQDLDLALLRQEENRVRNSIDILNLGRQRLLDRISALTIVSPAFGQITAFDASVGETKTAGSRIARLDIMDRLKLKAVLDEYYLPKISVGNKGTFTYLNTRGDDAQGSATVGWVSPDVKSNTFEVDFNFDVPVVSLHIGQRFDVRVELGKKREAVMLELGQFFQASGGRSVYVVDLSGATASKRDIVVGKSNPDYLEVLKGLAPGDQVVVSDYSGFRNLDKISIK